MEAILAGTMQAGDVVVIRYEGPKGGPGMREMLAVTGAIKGAGLGTDVLLITDGRFSGGTTDSASGTSRRRRRRRADRAGAEGDRIVLDLAAKHPRPAGRRRRAGAPPGGLGAAPAQNLNFGVAGKYAKLVGSAAQGAVCD